MVFEIVIPSSMEVYMRHYSHRFMLNKSTAKLSGVCAGMADYFNWSTTVVRVLTLVGFCFNPVLVLFAYVALALVLPSRRY
jgi:phage shock protein C